MDFIEIVKENYYQWAEKGCCEEAVQLNQKIGKPYFDTARPQFFTGNLNSQIVLVHLNPKRDEECFGQKNKHITFEDYWDFITKYGKITYGTISEDKKKLSVFDQKQVRFLKPFKILPFKENDKLYNLEIVSDNKLQIELVPFGSPNFNYAVIGMNNIKPFVERILNLLLLCERKYIIFCGKVFIELLQPFIVEQKNHTFKLNKNDGSKTRDDFNVICIKLDCNGKTINAVITPQYAKQGYPISHYGEMVKNLYDNFE